MRIAFEPLLVRLLAAQPIDLQALETPNEGKDGDVSRFGF
jgi:hypothetical protein